VLTLNPIIHELLEGLALQILCLLVLSYLCFRKVELLIFQDLDGPEYDQF